MRGARPTGGRPDPATAVARARRLERVERRWRIPVVATLLLTIPAFYSELVAADLPLPGLLSSMAYALAALVLAACAVHGAIASGDLFAALLRRRVDAVLVAGLIVAALLPASVDSTPALALRMAVALLTLVRMVWTLRHLVTRGSIAYVMGMALAVLLLSGVGFWWLEPATPNLADGLWLAFTTAATVGYGDVVPTTLASKIFSVFVVLLGYGVLSVATAALASAWVESDERRIEREILHDLHRQVAALREEIADLRRVDGDAPPGGEAKHPH